MREALAKMGRALTDRGAQPWRILSASTLKWLAIIVMVIDHFGIIWVWPDYLATRAAGTRDLYYLLREVGRFAMPVFCMTVSEAMVHTRSKPKYALRLAAFAAVSEIPYDWGLHAGWYDPAYQNVLWTLLLGFIALWVADELGRAFKAPGWVTVLLTVASCVACGWVADVAHASYGWYGVAMIGAIHLTRKNDLLKLALTFAINWRYCLMHSNWLQMWSMAGIAAQCLYNGKRGHGGWKYFFYVFYPAHIVILKLLWIYLG